MTKEAVKNGNGNGLKLVYSIIDLEKIACGTGKREVVVAVTEPIEAAFQFISELVIFLPEENLPIKILTNLGPGIMLLMPDGVPGEDDHTLYYEIGEMFHSMETSPDGEVKLLKRAVVA